MIPALIAGAAIAGGASWLTSYAQQKQQERAQDLWESAYNDLFARNAATYDSLKSQGQELKSLGLSALQRALADYNTSYGEYKNSIASDMGGSGAEYAKRSVNAGSDYARRAVGAASALAANSARMSARSAGLSGASEALAGMSASQNAVNSSYVNALQQGLANYQNSVNSYLSAQQGAMSASQTQAGLGASVQSQGASQQIAGAQGYENLANIRTGQATAAGGYETPDYSAMLANSLGAGATLASTLREGS